MYKCCFLACFCASQRAGWLRDKLTSADGPCWTVGGASLPLCFAFMRPVASTARRGASRNSKCQKWSVSRSVKSAAEHITSVIIPSTTIIPRVKPLPALHQVQQKTTPDANRSEERLPVGTRSRCVGLGVGVVTKSASTLSELGLYSQPSIHQLAFFTSLYLQLMHIIIIDAK